MEKDTRATPRKQQPCAENFQWLIHRNLAVDFHIVTREELTQSLWIICTREEHQYGQSLTPYTLTEQQNSVTDFGDESPAGYVLNVAVP